jgi:tRNA(fMet)-specific endonuclease VapC
LRFGAARLPRATRSHSLIEDLFLRATIPPWDSDAAPQYGQLRGTLEREGRSMGSLDMTIGADVPALGTVLVSNDHAFTRIRGPKVEDWIKGSRR